MMVLQAEGKLTAANSTSSSSEMEVWKWLLDEHRSECSEWMVDRRGWWEYGSRSGEDD
jgi:hypothetical protein